MTEAGPKSSADMSPQEILLAFFAEMCEWEKGIVKAQKAGQRSQRDLDHWRKRRQAINRRYCTAKKRVYSQPLAWQEPPEYDPTTEDITEVVQEKPRRVVIYTQQRASWKYKRRFVVLKKGDRWLLDSWQWSFDGVKWSRGII